SLRPTARRRDRQGQGAGSAPTAPSVGGADVPGGLLGDSARLRARAVEHVQRLPAGNQHAIADISLLPSGELIDQRPPALLEHVGAFGIAGPVDAFGPVTGHVEELLVAAAGEPHVLPTWSSDPLHGLPQHRVLPVQVVPYRLAALGPGPAAAQIHPVELFGDLHAGRTQQGGHDVAQFHHVIAHLPGAHPGAGHDQRHAGGAFVGVALTPHVVVAEHLAVVGGEAQQGVLSEAELAQDLQEPLDLVVDVGDVSVVAGAGTVDRHLVVPGDLGVRAGVVAVLGEHL